MNPPKPSHTSGVGITRRTILKALLAVPLVVTVTAPVIAKKDGFDPVMWLAWAERLGFRVFIFDAIPDQRPMLAIEEPVGSALERGLWQAINLPSEARDAKKRALTTHLREIGQVWPNRGGPK